MPSHYRSLNQRPIYGSKNSDIHDDMEISSHPIIDQPDRSSSTLRARQMSLPDPPEEFETYPNEYFQHIDQFHDDNWLEKYDETNSKIS